MISNPTADICITHGSRSDLVCNGVPWRLNFTSIVVGASVRVPETHNGVIRSYGLKRAYHFAVKKWIEETSDKIPFYSCQFEKDRQEKKDWKVVLDWNADQSNFTKSNLVMVFYHTRNVSCHRALRKRVTISCQHLPWSNYRSTTHSPYPCTSCHLSSEPQSLPMPICRK